MIQAHTPDRYHVEMIDGVEIEKPVPKRLHAIIQARILVWLATEIGADSVLPELDISLHGTDWLIPDVVVIPDDAKFEHGKLACPPELAVEILSPGQSFSNVIQKCERLIVSGTPTCWVIWPEKRLAYQFTLEAGLVQAIEHLSFVRRGSEAKSLPVAKLFEALPAEEAE